MKTYVQQIMIGSLCKNYDDALKTLKEIKSAGYDGMELNGFMIRPQSPIVGLLTSLAGMPTGKAGKLDWKKLVDESGLEVVSIHEDLGTIENKLDLVMEETKLFNTDKVVITGMYRFDYSNEKELLKLCDRLNRAGESLKKEGITLLYHNHNCELLSAGNKKAYDIIIENTNPEFVSVEFDSYWFQEAGADPKEYMKKLGKRMVLWHVTDRGSRKTGTIMTPIIKNDCVELGMGNMDLKGMMKIARENGVESIILESHRNWIDKSPLSSIKLSSNYLRSELLQND